MRFLVQFRGTLAVMEGTSAKDRIGKCPDCGGKEFFDDYGWVRCYGCGFAVLRSDLQRATNELYLERRD